jgi:phenylacetate-CoA ligase
MRWSRHFDEQVETMPHAWLRRLEEEQLAEQVARLRECSAFYADRLEGPAGAILTVEDLARLPVTTFAELAASQVASPPFGGLACADPVAVVRARALAAPGERVIVAAYTERDLRTAAETGARCLWAAGLRPDDVVLDLLLAAGTEPIEAAGATAVAGVRHSDAELLGLWSRLAPTVLLATGQRALTLADEARRMGESPHALALSLMLIAAGPAADERAKLEDVWGARVAFVHGHPAVSDLFAAECERRDGLHFLAHGSVLLESVDGEETLSHLDRDATPLLRLQTGHRVTLLEGECPCGRTGFRFRV